MIQATEYIKPRTKIDSFKKKYRYKNISFTNCNNFGQLCGDSIGKISKVKEAAADMIDSVLYEVICVKYGRINVNKYQLL